VLALSFILIINFGSEPVREIAEIKRENSRLKLLSPTDCVKDRLAAFYHWNDRQCLEQAILVSLDNNVDLSEIARWSNKESMTYKYNKFEILLRERKTSRR